LLTACSALALTACGGDDQRAERRTDTAESTPTIERAVAERLASRSDKVATLLDSGDACGAASEAARLRDDLTSAINDGAIPEPYLEDLSGLVNEISAQIPPCQPPPPSTETGDGGDGDD
jgi:hypothetical protein